MIIALVTDHSQQMVAEQANATRHTRVDRRASRVAVVHFFIVNLIAHYAFFMPQVSSRLKFAEISDPTLRG